MFEKSAIGRGGTGIATTVLSKLNVADAFAGTGGGGGDPHIQGAHAVTEKLQVPEMIVAREVAMDTIITANAQGIAAKRRRIGGSSLGLGISVAQSAQWIKE